ncbi:photoreceptor cilium actin regulator [Anoplopoma fimbria]|uniref:photoreceptor cilium actin regulator n=1 Tax=Anoplopoma fimbria TaxID=229290 RepID=UPI0023EACF2C|nr:photoreceptor cilium actin regulator [Anoplopoma fimbria]
MGCSPSKGNHFGTLGPMRQGRMLPPAPQGSPRDSHFEDGGNRNSTGSTDGDAKERTAAGQTQVIQKEAHLTPQKKRYVTDLAPEAVSMDKLGSQEMDNNTASQRKEKNIDMQEATEKKPGRKQKKMTRGIKGLKKKDKDKGKPPEQKVDFPEPLVKAHQAAYAFLNPSINKYDVLLGLLEEATQTQGSAQTMVAFMALRYEEMIQGLEEMADEGEKVLKENGEHLAWPSQMKNLSSSPPLKSGSANIEPPPDLLQQLLQYTTQRMRNVSQTVAGIGECALEEAVEYFASVSELLEEKLKVKRAVETRLMQLLSRIEMASLRKPGPEDSALFSEDSGIGAESESLAGSERRHRRESCASTGTNRTTPVSPMGYTSMNIRQGVSRKKLASQISPSVSLTSLNSLGSTCTIMANYQRDSLLGSVSLDYGEEDDDDEEEMNRDMGDVGIRKGSNSSTVYREQQHPCRLPPKRIENPQNVEMTLKMKNAISGRIQFVPSQNASAKTKGGGSPKTSRRQWTEELERPPRRPQTTAPIRKAVVKKTAVARERRSQSAESLRSKGEDPTLLELERTQNDLNQRLQRMSKSKAGGNTKPAPSKQNQGTSPAQSPAIHRKHPSPQKNCNPQPLDNKAGLTRSNSKKQEVASDVEDDKPKEKKTFKGPVKATPPPSPPSSPRPSSGLYRGRNSVRRLIDTFSQGIEDPEGPKVLGPLIGVRKYGVPVLPGLGNMEAVLSSGITSCRPETTEKTNYLDLDSLPPPPLEVLMDNSFESAQNLLAGVADEGATKPGKSPSLKRAAVSQRLRASVQSVTVLPSKGGLPQASKVISLPRADQQHTSSPSKVNRPDVQLEADSGKEKDSLYQQDRKIIHLRHSSDLQRSAKSYVSTNPSASQEESTDIQDGGNFSVPGCNTTVSTVPPASMVRSQAPATPPGNRGRMLPSTPSTPSSLHRRLPSPHNFKRQPTPPSSASPSVNRKLPTQPAVQGRLPSPPVTKQNISNSNSSFSYPFKAPSPPASPKVQRWSRENITEDSSSARMINNARSVFCPASPSMFESQPCPVPRPPQAWTSTGVSFLLRSWGSRGRFPVSVQGPRPFIRRSHSDRRPSLNLPPRSPGASVAETCGSEPALCSQGLDDEPTREEELWGSQSNLRAPLRSASHPDLCVVGQSLHRD